VFHDGKSFAIRRGVRIDGALCESFACAGHGAEAVGRAHRRKAIEKGRLEQMHGLGEPVPLRLTETSPAVGKTLAEINLRGLTGASVLAIARGDQGIIVPTATEVLQADDVLALAGTRDAVAAATNALQGIQA
jgi:monovalent cation:H+ antiporter-2, CPA2 family